MVLARMSLAEALVVAVIVGAVVMAGIVALRNRRPPEA